MKALKNFLVGFGIFIVLVFASACCATPFTTASGALIGGGIGGGKGAMIGGGTGMLAGAVIDYMRGEPERLRERQTGLRAHPYGYYSGVSCGDLRTEGERERCSKG